MKKKVFSLLLILSVLCFSKQRIIDFISCYVTHYVHSSDILTITNLDTGETIWGGDAGTTYNTPTPPQVVTKKCEHNYVIDNDACVMATCQENGKHVFKCSKCGDVTSEVVEASEQWHNFKQTDKDFVEATCSTPMEVTYVCSVCNEEKHVTKDIKGAHVFEETRVEPTCVEEGKIIRTCTLCGAVEEEAIPMIQHKYEERIAKEPSYFTTGVKESACSMCGDVEHTELIPALWETWQQVVVICIPIVIIALGIVLAIVIKKKRR